MGKDKEEGMDIKWTPGPGPAPLPYSKRAREAMGYSDDDKPWAHPDPPAGERLGLGSDPLQDGRIRAGLFMFFIALIAFIWLYRKVVKRDHSPFFYEAPTGTEEMQASDEDMQIAREARLKRFEDQKSSYADIMMQASGGWTPDGDGIAGDGEGEGDGGGDTSEGLRHRARNQEDD